MTVLARDIAKKVESDMEYPGQIKVNVIRESRAIEYAKQNKTHYTLKYSVFYSKMLYQV